MPLGSFEARFWSHVERRGPDDCWAWTGTTNGDGRGRVHIRFIGGCKGGIRGKRVRAYAYAVAWELTNGPIPEGMKACHRCDNPNCVNPAHLFIGTQYDNILDMHAKGRANSYFKTEEGRRYASLSRQERRDLKAAHNALNKVA